MKCGFKIGGGIDQDFTKSPQGYTDNVRYLTLNTIMSVDIIFQNIICVYFYILFYISLIHYIILMLQELTQYFFLGYICNRSA